MDYSNNLEGGPSLAERLEQIMHGTNVGTWEWNVQTGDTIFNERWASLIGYTIEELQPISIKTWLRFAHPDDLPESERLLREHFEGKQEYYEYESRMRHKDGHWIWVLDRGKVISRTPDGKPLMMMGTHQDITERKQAEAVNHELLQRIGELGKHLPGFIYQYELSPDFTSRFPFASDNILHIYGVSPDEVVHDATPVFKALHPDDFERVKESIVRSAQTMEQWQDRYRVNLPDGSTIWVEGVATPQRLANGNVLWHGYIQDITDRKAVEEALQLAKEQAEAASKAKSQFLVNMSHELRTPLNGVIGFTELLKTTRLDSLQKEFVHGANISGHNLLRIINDILDFSKIEAGMLELEVTRTDVQEIAANSLEMIKLGASDKGVEVLLNLQQGFPQYAWVDGVRLTQILTNLLSNAVKFTERGEIELSAGFEPAEKDNAVITFSVRDTGIGITRDQQKKLFRVFSQADTSTTRRFGGTGLGLAISQKIARKMNSEITIRSEQGVGSTFSFTLKTRVEFSEEKTTAGPLHVKRCLIVDDNASNRSMLESTLRGMGIETESCENGLDAMKLLERSRVFDAMLCDYHMPYIDGLEIIAMIRSKLNLTAQELPVILMHSSSDDATVHRRCDELGVAHRISKPVRTDELIKLMQGVHEHHTVPAEPMPATAEAPEKSPGQQVRVSVLVAEDNTMNMTLVRGVLRNMRQKVRILEASDGGEAIAVYQRERPDIILMDVQMPGTDGIAATRTIRSMEAGEKRHTPIIALTAGVLTEDRDTCLQAGMDAFLSKPLDFKKLQHTLDTYTRDV